MRQLDALRAFAVLAVLVSHFAEGWLGATHLFGEWGVRLFFVLSGFLITAILLKGKDSIASGAVTPGEFLRSFFARRMLRLFPLLAAVLLVAAALDMKPVRETFFWHITYLSNFYFFLRGDWHGSVSPLWSLAVEEQFYLVWPILILFVPARWLLPSIVASIAVAPLFRAWMAQDATWFPGVTILPLSCFDALGLGALLALVGHRFGLDTPVAIRFRRGMLGLGAPLFLFGVVGWEMSWISDRSGIALSFLAVPLLSTWLIAAAAVGFRGWVGRVLEWKPLVYVGTISYGVYLNHLFVRDFVGGISIRIGIPLLDSLWPARMAVMNGATYTIVLTIASISVAAASWHYYERPINSLKQLFPYRRAVGPAPALVPQRSDPGPAYTPATRSEA